MIDRYVYLLCFAYLVINFILVVYFIFMDEIDEAFRTRFKKPDQNESFFGPWY